MGKLADRFMVARQPKAGLVDYFVSSLLDAADKENVFVSAVEDVVNSVSLWVWAGCGAVKTLEIVVAVIEESVIGQEEKILKILGDLPLI